MFDFDDELIIDSYRIPCLIWIQLVVMLLLIVLIYHFCAMALDLSGASSSPSSSAAQLLTSAGECRTDMPQKLFSAAVSLYDAKASEKERKKGEMGTSTSKRIAREDIQEGNGPPTEDATHLPLFEQSHHPCHIIGLAKEAFLKCLGFDPTSGSPSNRKRGKDR